MPWVWLGLISAGVSFASTYKPADWLITTVWALAGVLVFILFLLPALSYMATFLDVSDSGLSIRLGLGSSKRIELSWSDVSTVTSSSLKGITIRTKDETEYVLRGFSNQKAIVAELVSLLGRK